MHVLEVMVVPLVNGCINRFCPASGIVIKLPVNPKFRVSVAEFLVGLVLVLIEIVQVY